MVHFEGQALDRTSDNPDAFRRFGIDFDLRRASRDPHLSLQAAHLAKVSRFQFKYGLDIYEGRSRTRDTLFFVFPSDPPEPIEQDYDFVRKPVKFRTAFVQSSFAVTPKLAVTAGLNYDWANASNDFDEEQRPRSKWNPQAGFLFSPFASSTLRFAAMRVLQTPFRARLLPSHLNGFILNQNEDLFTLTNAYNLGWDQRVGGRTFIRTTAFKRDRAIPALGQLPGGDTGTIRFAGDLYGGGVAWNQFLSERWTVVPEYGLTHANDVGQIRHDHEMNLGLFYVHPRGFQIGVAENYLNQHGRLGFDPTEVAVFTTNLTLRYELPRKHAVLQLRITNLSDRRYEFLADPLALDPRVPSRQVSFLLRTNF